MLGKNPKIRLKISNKCSRSSSLENKLKSTSFDQKYFKQYMYMAYTTPIFLKLNLKLQWTLDPYYCTGTKLCNYY